MKSHDEESCKSRIYKRIDEKLITVWMLGGMSISALIVAISLILVGQWGLSAVFSVLFIFLTPSMFSQYCLTALNDRTLDDYLNELGVDTRSEAQKEQAIKEAVRTANLEEIASSVKELMDILNTVEVSDCEEREFHPTTIRSCRVLDQEKLNTIFSKFERLKTEV